MFTCFPVKYKSKTTIEEKIQAKNQANKLI